MTEPSTSAETAQPESTQPTARQPAAGGQTDGLAVAALVIGIVALIFCWVPFLNIILAILALVFGIIGTARGISRGMAIAGLALGGISLGLILIFFIGAVVAMITGAQSLPSATIGR